MKNQLILMFLFSLLCVSCGGGGGGTTTETNNIMSTFTGTYTVNGGDITYGVVDNGREDMLFDITLDNGEVTAISISATDNTPQRVIDLSLNERSNTVALMDMAPDSFDQVVIGKYNYPTHVYEQVIDNGGTQMLMPIDYIEDFTRYNDASFEVTQTSAYGQILQFYDSDNTSTIKTLCDDYNTEVNPTTDLTVARPRLFIHIMFKDNDSDRMAIAAQFDCDSGVRHEGAVPSTNMATSTFWMTAYDVTK